MDVELVCFNIISNVGMAKSCYVEAMRAANKGDFDLANEKIEEGDKNYAKGHDVHMDLISAEANGEDTKLSLLMIHAEDQMMAAETIKVMALQIIELNKKIGGVE